MIEQFFQSAFLPYLIVFVFGTLIGSFLNVVILRLPPRLEHDWRCQCKELLGEDSEDSPKPPGVVIGRSRCPRCGHKISALENLPIVSYLKLRGKCSNCAEKISPRYPLVELLTGILFLIIAWYLGPTPAGLSGLLLTSFLVALTGIDFDHQLLPDNLTLPLLWVGIILSYWNIHTDLESSVAGAVIGYLSLWLIYHLFRVLTGKEGMGYGDFKLMGALGAWLGWQSLPLVILLSSVSGAVFGLVLIASGKFKKETPMPFGPFIAVAGWITLIWGDQIITRYIAINQFG